MMKLKVSLAGIFGVLLVFGLVLAGCSDDSGGSGGGGLNLGAIDEDTTGRETIAVTDVALTGAHDGTYTDDMGAFSCGVSGGKLSFTLDEPNGSDLISESELNGVANTQYGELSFLFGKTDGENVLTISDSTAKYYVVSRFSMNDGDTHYEVSRSAEATDGKTYSDASSINYVYVDKNVTLTRAAKDIVFEEGRQPHQYKAINLELKTGWNLVQTDGHSTPTSAEHTVGIATKNVPWSGGSRAGGGD